jgi:hypothetical protein
MRSLNRREPVSNRPSTGAGTACCRLRVFSLVISVAGLLMDAADRVALFRGFAPQTPADRGRILRGSVGGFSAIYSFWKVPAQTSQTCGQTFPLLEPAHIERLSESHCMCSPSPADVHDCGRESHLARVALNLRYCRHLRRFGWGTRIGFPLISARTAAE